MSVMFAEDGPVMTFLSPFITEPLGYDRVLDVTVKNGKKDQGVYSLFCIRSIYINLHKSFMYVGWC